MSLIKSSNRTIALWRKWPKKSLAIQYDSPSLVVGVGEERLAKILKGKVQGGSVSYDIVDNQGRKWEVKEPVQVKVDGSGGKIRAGVEGVAAIVPSRTKIDEVTSIISSGIKKLIELNEIDRIFSKEEIEAIMTFIENDVQMIKKGELSKGRIERLKSILTMIHKSSKLNSQGRKSISLGDEICSIHRIIDSNTYIKIGKMLGISNEELRIEIAELSASLFDDKAFSDPDDFIKSVWEPACLATDVFGHTDGIILVREDSYRIVERKDLNSVFVFDNITQGKPHFKIIA